MGKPLIVPPVVRRVAKDTVDVVELLKLGNVSTETVSRRLSGEDLEQFRRLVMVARLEKEGRVKEAQRVTMRALAHCVGLGQPWGVPK
jgi:hypothetical protein